VAYNLMKLERHAFAWTGDARWMDAYERSLWNCRLGTQNPQGLKQYFFPLAAGYWRYYNSAENSFWCCTGTGAEEFAKFNDSIYFHDGDGIWVNHFIASELTWKAGGVTLRQETAFPAQPGTTLRVSMAKPRHWTMCIRIPAWTAEGGSVKVNGQTQEAFARPGSYLTLTRLWHDGDKVELTLPMRLYTEGLLGDENNLRAALYGPMVLAANLGQGPGADDPLRIGGYDTGPSAQALPPPAEAPRSEGSPDAADWVKVVSAKDLTFRSGTKDSLEVKPMYRITGQKYAVYWATEKKA
jgi:hypothetical protein